MAVSRRKFIKAGTSVAALGIAGQLHAQEKPGMAGVAASPDHLQQPIDGFGFSEAFHMARVVQNLAEHDKTNLLNLMFSANGGMGYSILRNQIGEGPLGAGAKDGTVASIDPTPKEYNWTGDEDQIWLMNEAKKRGCTRFLSTSWSPPAWMKSNNNTYDGQLKPAMYQAFADYLATYVLEYKKRSTSTSTPSRPRTNPASSPR